LLFEKIFVTAALLKVLGRGDRSHFFGSCSNEVTPASALKLIGNLHWLLFTHRKLESSVYCISWGKWTAGAILPLS